jgi:hypothetical protein
MWKPYVKKGVVEVPGGAKCNKKGAKSFRRSRNIRNELIQTMPRTSLALKEVRGNVVLIHGTIIGAYC